MNQVDPFGLVEYLRHGNSRSNVGLWRMPLSKIGQEEDIAFRLNVEAIDISAYYRSKLPANTEYARLSVSRLFDVLDEIAQSSGSSDCVFIYNFDLLLAGLKKEEERIQMWQDLYNRFPNRKRALLLAIPETAIHLLPTEEVLEKWGRDSRLY